LEAEVSFTDKALAEISEIMALVKDLTRDANDVLTTGNPHFRAYIASSAQNVMQRVDELGLEHQKRLVVGICTPKASFLYLDILHSLKRVAQALSHLSEKT
jgi:phosphate:Na+ symporter